MKVDDELVNVGQAIGTSVIQLVELFGDVNHVVDERIGDDGGGRNAGNNEIEINLNDHIDMLKKLTFSTFSG